jgi:hypothetical protein
MNKILPFLFIAGGLLFVFGGSFGEANPRQKARNLYSAMATLIENDSSRAESKQSIKSVAEIQRAENRALKYTFAKGEAPDELLDEVKAFFEPLEGVVWPEYRDRWIEQARKVSEEL